MEGALSGDERGKGNSLEMKVYDVEGKQRVVFEQSAWR